MAIRPHKLNLSLLMLAVSTLALSAGAQSAGQPIIFSTPQTDAGSPEKPSPTAANSPSGVLPGTLQAPAQFFDFDPPGDRPLAVVSPGLSPQQQRMQRLLNDRKNWIFMTPEEILGATTTEKMLQPPERDALGREKNPTQLERFLQRESQARNGLTNGWQDSRASSPWNLTRDQDNANLLDSTRSSQADAAQNLGQVLSGPGNRAAADQKGYSGWDAFSQTLPPATTKPEPDQLAAMERFRQLLSSGPDDDAQSSANGRLVPAPKTAMDPLLMRPDFVPNPAGASFIPLGSGITRPAGLTPLPDAVPNLLPAAAAPTWKVQPPPWLLPGPQPFVIPQRKGL